MRYKGTKMSHLQDRVTLQQVNDEEQQARELLAQAGYHGMIGKNTYSKITGVSSSFFLSFSFHYLILLNLNRILDVPTTWI